MKKLLVCMSLLLAVLGISGNAFAQEMTAADIQRWLEPVLGDWYHLDGGLAMTIGKDRIDGCRILGSTGLGMVEPPTSGTLRVDKDGASRQIQLEVFGEGVHQYLRVDGAQTLRRVPQEVHFESVQGLYLGMTREQLLQACGNPGSKEAAKGQVLWQYPARGLGVLLKGNIVTGLRLYRNGASRFDRSGLGADASLADYAQAYGLTAVPKEPVSDARFFSHYAIGQDEYLVFKPDCVQLSVYSSWLFD